MKTKSFCTAKDTIIQAKRQSIEWEWERVINYTTDRGLVSKIYKELKNPNIEKTTQLK